MATEVKATQFTGGASVVPGGSGGKPHLAEMVRGMIDDVTELRTQFIALLQKLDADIGINDTNYESLLTPAAQNVIKG